MKCTYSHCWLRSFFALSKLYAFPYLFLEQYQCVLQMLLTHTHVHQLAMHCSRIYL